MAKLIVATENGSLSWDDYMNEIQKVNQEIINKIGSVLGDEMVSDLNKIFELRGDYEISIFIPVQEPIRGHEMDSGPIGENVFSVDEILDGAIEFKLETINEKIKKSLNHLTFSSECKYTSIRYDVNVEKMFYNGKLFGEEWVRLGMPTYEEHERTTQFANEVFYDKIVEVIGREYIVPDGGSDYVFYIKIHNSVYDEVVDRLNAWFEEHGILEYMKIN